MMTGSRKALSLLLAAVMTAGNAAAVSAEESTEQILRNETLYAWDMSDESQISTEEGTADMPVLTGSAEYDAENEKVRLNAASGAGVEVTLSEPVTAETAENIITVEFDANFGSISGQYFSYSITDTIGFEARNSANAVIGNAVVTVTDSKYGIVIEPESDGTYHLCDGAYSYTVKAEGYETVTEELELSQATPSKTITVTMAKSGSTDPDPTPSATAEPEQPTPTADPGEEPEPTPTSPASSGYDNTAGSWKFDFGADTADGSIGVSADKSYSDNLDYGFIGIKEEDYKLSAGQYMDGFRMLEGQVIELANGSGTAEAPNNDFVAVTDAQYPIRFTMSVENGWVSPNAQSSMTVETDDDHGNYVYFAPSTTRNMKLTLPEGIVPEETYVIELDLGMSSGNSSMSEFAVITSDTDVPNNGNVTGGYLFKLSSTEKSYSNTTAMPWTVNDNADDTVTFTQNGTNPTWAHLKMTVDPSTGEVHVVITENEQEIYNKTLQAVDTSSNAVVGFNFKAGRAYSKGQFDNIRIYTADQTAE